MGDPAAALSIADPMRVANPRTWPSMLLVAAVAAALGCGNKGAAGAPGPAPAPTIPAAAPGPGAAPAASPAAAPPAPPPIAAPPPPAPARPGADFTVEAKQLFREVACGTREPIADAARAKVVDKHCAWVDAQLGRYRDNYVVGARGFFDALVPDDVPRTVVYPFGGGDLISALVAFPDADEITTISLEQAGDPRRIGELTPAQLGDSLGQLRGQLGGTLSVGSNTSENLSSSQRNDLPAQVSSFLLGLAANGFEPVGMRFIRLEADGALHYLTADEIAAIETAAAEARARAKGKDKAKAAKGKARKHDWLDPNFSEAFANVEIEYRRAGDPSDRVRVHRHFGWNLRDADLVKHPELMAHLAGKGKVAGLVKGASYLLWRNDFSTMRDYLLGHIAWMLSDSTGIPPLYARKAGMVQVTYGQFTGPFLEGASPKHSEEFKALWEANPKRRLPVRFGYVDAEKHPHLVVTRPK